MAEADERYALVFEQTVRAVTQQTSAIDTLRTRAGTVVSAAALVSSFLGAATLRDPHLPKPAIVFTVLALAGLVATVVATVVILLPYDWLLGFKATVAIRDYVEADPPASIDEMRRDIALHMQSDVKANAVRLDRLYVGFRIAVVAVGVQVVCWLAALLLS